MNVELLRIFGNPHIGVYVFVNNSIAIVPPGLDEEVRNKIIETLDVEVIETKIAGSILNGVLIAGNDHGLIFPRTILDEEFEYLKKNLSRYGFNLYIARSKNTALGNLLLTNNKACIVGSDIEKQEIIKISEVLGVEVFSRDVMYLTIPGSLAVVTDNGGVIHPDVSDEELEELKNIFKVYIERATVNSGIPFIKSGLIANNKGILIGENTTGPEMLRIRRGFQSMG
ncbi:MAG: translation initiation factor IF-6 [Desulfurococcales archaeon ex4484_58]|nr:MAG: translation initiation factor IF-6 [Desulfurococcales archaeon ex4484_58]